MGSFDEVPGLGDLSSGDLFRQSGLGSGDYPTPVDWAALTEQQRTAELAELKTWVQNLVEAWPLQADELPPCWHRHESLIRILSAVRDAYRTAYAPHQGASASADWMFVWHANLAYLTRWVERLGCTAEKHVESGRLPRQGR